MISYIDFCKKVEDERNRLDIKIAYSKRALIYENILLNTKWGINNIKTLSSEMKKLKTKLGKNDVYIAEYNGSMDIYKILWDTYYQYNLNILILSNSMKYKDKVYKALLNIDRYIKTFIDSINSNIKYVNKNDAKLYSNYDKLRDKMISLYYNCYKVVLLYNFREKLYKLFSKTKRLSSDGYDITVKSSKELYSNIEVIFKDTSKKYNKTSEIEHFNNIKQYISSIDMSNVDDAYKKVTSMLDTNSIIYANIIADTNFLSIGDIAKKELIAGDENSQILLSKIKISMRYSYYSTIDRIKSIKECSNDNTFKELEIICSNLYSLQIIMRLGRMCNIAELKSVREG